VLQVTDESLERLLETSQTLHGKLVTSPLWEMIKTEPVIVQWLGALGDVESQLKKKHESPDDKL
jgi:hypothetical protein